MMKVVFEMGGIVDDRIFNDVLTLETGEYEHGKEATLRQEWGGDVREFPVRGYENVRIESHTVFTDEWYDKVFPSE